MSSSPQRVVIGIDPHKRSWTASAVDTEDREGVFKASVPASSPLSAPTKPTRPTAGPTVCGQNPAGLAQQVMVP